MNRDCTNSNSNYKRDYIAHKTTRTTKARAIQIQIKSIIWVSAHGVAFQHTPIDKLYASPLCTIQQQKSISYIYAAHSTKPHLMLSNRKFYWKCPAAAAILIDLFHNPLFRFYSPVPCLFVLVFNNQFKSFIIINHIFKSPIYIITFIKLHSYLNYTINLHLGLLPTLK